MSIKKKCDNETNEETTPKEEKRSAIAIIDVDIPKHDDKDVLFTIKSTTLEQLGNLEYSAYETKGSEGKYILTFCFKEPISIYDIEITNNVNLIRDYISSGITKYNFEYNNVGFTLKFKVSKETLKGKGLKNITESHDEYPASMRSGKKTSFEVKVADLTKFQKVEIPILLKNSQKVLEDLANEIQKKLGYKKDDSHYKHVFCTINDLEQMQILPLKMTVKQSGSLNYFYAPIISPTENKKGIGEHFYIRCKFMSEKEIYPYLLLIFSNTEICKIFECIRKLITVYPINHKDAIKFLRIKLCFLNYQIQLNENDKTSTFGSIAHTLLYSFSNIENCEDLYLQVKCVLYKSEEKNQ